MQTDFHACMKQFKLPLLLKTLKEMCQQISPLKVYHHITANNNQPASKMTNPKQSPYVQFNTT